MNETGGGFEQMTAEITNVEQVLSALSHDPARLLGMEETQWLDFKSQPYGLDDDVHAIELAKDVSAFANTSGGVIVVGVKTEQKDSTPFEVASQIRALPPGMVDPERIQKKVHELVYPQLDLDLQRFESGDERKEIWAIRVPAGPDRDLPFMTTREVVDGSGALVRHVFAVYRRVGSMCVAFPQSQVQSWMHASWMPAPATLPETEGEAGTVDADRELDSEIADSGIEKNEGVFSIQLRIDPPTQLRSFHDGAPDSVSNALGRLPFFRYAGFNFGGLREAERVRGHCLRLVDNGKNVLALTETGLLTAIQRNYQLTWAWERAEADPAKGMAINSVALAEFTLEVCRAFAELVLPRVGRTPAVYWRIKMFGLLEPYPLVLYGGGPNKYQRPARSVQEGNVWQTDWHRARALEYQKVAFSLLTEVYRKFGWDAAAIPFQQEGALVPKLLPRS